MKKEFSFLKFLKILSITFAVFLSVSGISAQQTEKRLEIENDGWKLVGELLIPKAEKAVPAVILLNKAYGTRKVYENLAGHLAKNGIASLRLDLRAHGESINKGTFGPPFDEKMRALLVGSDTDITAAFNYLKKIKEIDAGRIGVVGGSYSGEEMMVSARKNGYAKAYVALSPGSYSEESLANIDKSKSSYLFIVSAEEIHLQGFLADVRKQSKRAQTMEVAGNKHATGLFDEHPELAEMIAVWFKYHL